jgi:hypothetical protein
VRLTDGGVGDVGESVGRHVDRAEPAFLELVAAAGRGVRVQLDDFRVGGFDGAGLDGGDEVLCGAVPQPRWRLRACSAALAPAVSRRAATRC